MRDSLRAGTGLFWTYDDAFNLSFAARFAPADYFFSPAVAGTLLFRMFTPMLFAAYDIDLALFGHEPRAHYVRVLASLVGMLVVLFLVYRFWFSAALSFLAVMLALIAPATAEWAIELMARHYVEGALLSSLATLLFIHSFHGRAKTYAIAAALLYLGACLAKEIYVPLPLLWMILPIARPRQRIRQSAAALVATAIYLAWRLSTIGTLGGGYGWATASGERLNTFALFPLRLIEGISPEQTVLGYAAFTIAIVALLLMRNARTASTTVIAAMLAVGPLIAVAQEIEPRYVVLLSVVMSTTIVAAASHLISSGRRVAAAVLFTSFAIVLMVANRITWNSMFEKSSRMSAESRAFLALSSDHVLATPVIPPGAIGELRQMASRVYGRESSPTWFYDELFLCANRHQGKKLMRYSLSLGRVVDATDAITSESGRFCRELRTMPLSGHFEKRGEVLGWSLGPYETGRYRFVLDEGTMAYDMPRSSHFKVGDVGVLPLRIRYDSPAGWTTYSPELKLDFTSRADFQWTR